MSNPWLILGTLAFFASFGINLLMSQDLGGSLIAGATALGTAFITAAVVNRYHNRSSESRLAGLKYQIRQLQRQYQEEEAAILALEAERERIGASLNGMQMQVRQYQLAGAGGLGGRPILSWDLSAEADDAIEMVPQGRAIAPGYGMAPGAYDGEVAYSRAEAVIAPTQGQQLQLELAQLHTQVEDYRYLREQLLQELRQLNQQQDHLEAGAIALRQEVAELEQCRQEGEQYVAYIESKRQELETGTNPLQKALKQLQSQVDASRAELQTLEQRITATRQEKVLLERELANAKQQQKQVSALQATVQELIQQRTELEQAIAAGQQQHTAQQTALDQAIAAQAQAQAELHSTQAEVRSLSEQKIALEHQLTHLQEQQEQLGRVQTVLQELDQQVRDRQREKEELEQQLAPKAADPVDTPAAAPPAEPLAAAPKPPKPGKTKPSKHKHRAIAPAAPAAPEPATLAPYASPKPGLKTRPQTTLTVTLEEATAPEPPAHGLPDVWTDLMVQLPDCELQALQAIATRKNVLQALGQLAQENFVSVEELVDLINQRAVQTVGETIIHAPSGFDPPSIVRSQTRMVQRLIETYEFLTQ